MSEAAPDAGPLAPSRLADRGRRLRQAWPLVVAISLLLSGTAVVFTIASEAVELQDRLVGAWKTDKGVTLAIERAGEEYRLRVGDGGEWVPSNRIVSADGGRTLFANVSADSMSILTAGEESVATRIEVAANEDGAVELTTAWTADAPSRRLSGLDKARSSLDWLAVATAGLAAAGLIATAVVGRAAGIGAGDDLVYGVGLAAGVGLLITMLGAEVLLVVVAPLLLLAWFLILTRWLFAAVPDIGSGLAAVFTRQGRRAFAESIASQDEQSDRGDALERVADSMLSEKGSPGEREA